MTKHQEPAANGQRPTILFVHIQKTAGTTLDQIIARNYRPGEVFALLPSAEAQVTKYMGMSPAEKGKIRLIKGHMHYGLHELVPGPSAYFTFLRDPIERVISQYNHIRRNPLHPAHRHIVVNKLDLKAALERGLDVMLFNGQVRVLSGARVGLPPGRCTSEHLVLARRNLADRFAVTGLTEEFDTSLLMLQRAFGWRRLYYTRHNVAPRKQQEQVLDPDTLAAVKEANQLDLELYAFAKKLFAERAAAAETLAGDLARLQRMNRLVEPVLRSTLWLRQYPVRTMIKDKLGRADKSNKGDCPVAPIPDALRGTEYGTVTHKRIVKGLPKIGRRLLAQNSFSPAVANQIEALCQGIPEETIRLLEDEQAPDAADWTGYVTPYLSQNWLEVPWFFVESYFYRRVLAISGYFSDEPGRGVDPFKYHKRQSLKSAGEATRALSGRMVEWLDEKGQENEALAELLAVSVWAGQEGSGLAPAGDESKPAHIRATQRQAQILVNDTAAVVDYLTGLEGHLGRVDVILSGAGFELIAALYLALLLLEKNVAGKVYLQAKIHPAFDLAATAEDVFWTLASLANDQHQPAAMLGRKLQGLVESGRLNVADDWFWSSPMAMWQMPEGLRQELSRSQLVISQGDTNYRRLLGDRFWPYTTPFADIVCTMPAPVVALRALESEIAAGMREGQPMELAEIDPDWLVDGRWGVIQFANLT